MCKMKVLVTGYNGQLGYDIVRELKCRNINCIGTTREELDIVDKEKVILYIKKINPTHIIHCAAWTKVDKAEDESSLCRKINVDGTENIATMCDELNIPLIYFSTDYVFGGNGEAPYKVDDKVNPLCVYAKTKYDGELIVSKLKKYFIIRISWVFGINGNNFVKTMIKLSQDKNELKIVDDQIGSPTYTYDLSKLVCDMIMTEKYGVYHATNEGFTSWANFAKEIFKRINKNVKVIGISTEEYNAKAKRPKNSRLDKSSLVNNGFKLLPSWQDALDRYLKELNIEV